MFDTFTVTATDNDTHEVYWSMQYDREGTFQVLADFDIDATELPWVAHYDVGYGCTLTVAALVRFHTRQLLAA
jgi:hypothetical protein